MKLDLKYLKTEIKVELKIIMELKQFFSILTEMIFGTDITLMLFAGKFVLVWNQP